MVILYSLLARTTLKYDSSTLTTTLPVTYMHTVEWILLPPKYQAGGLSAAVRPPPDYSSCVGTE